jgi:hypothetical protein
MRGSGRIFDFGDGESGGSAPDSRIALLLREYLGVPVFGISSSAGMALTAAGIGGERPPSMRRVFSKAGG